MKKKIFSTVMALCLILTFMPTMAFADSTEPTLAPTLTVTPETVNVGDTVTVKINSQEMPENSNEYCVLMVDLNYDTTVFEAVENSHTKMLTVNGGNYSTVFNPNNSGKASWSFDFATSQATVFPAYELEIQFTAKKAGTAQFEVTKFDLSDAVTDSYAVTLPAAKSVTVAKGPLTETKATNMILAPLHDAAGAASDTELNAAVKLSAVTNGEATLTYKQLKKHTNGATPAVEGYWVGVGVEIPTMTDTDKLFYRAGSAGTWQELNLTEEKYTVDGKDYVCVYADASKKSALDIDLAVAASEEDIAGYTCAKVTLVEEIAHPETAIKAPLEDHAPVGGATGESTPGEAAPTAIAASELYTSYTISYDKETGIAAITAKNLKEHYNANGTKGKWIGVGVPAVEDAITVYYAYGEDKPTSWNSASVASELYNEDGKDYICFYQDAATEPSRTIWYAFDDTDVYYQVIVNGTLSNTTGGAAGGNSYAQKPTVIADETKGDVTLSSDGRTATITPKDGFEIDNVTVNGVDKGAADILTGLKTGDKVEVTYKEKASAFDLTSYLTDLKVVARSEKTAKGNVKVTVTSVTDADGNDVDLSELKAQGYTVEYKFYRSVKKASKYKATLSKQLGDNTYTNTTGETGTKYYYKARIVVKDGNGIVVGQTELKQCKYACRTWTK